MTNSYPRSFVFSHIFSLKLILMFNWINQILFADDVIRLEALTDDAPSAKAAPVTRQTTFAEYFSSFRDGFFFGGLLLTLDPHKHPLLKSWSVHLEWYSVPSARAQSHLDSARSLLPPPCLIYPFISVIRNHKWYSKYFNS